MGEMGQGFPGLLTKVGLGTFMDPRYDRAMINEKTKKEGNRLSHTFPTSLEKKYLFYTPAQADSSPLRATTADEDGNLRRTRRNACPASRWTWPWLQRQQGLLSLPRWSGVAATGTLDSGNVKVPGILDYICVAEHPDRMMQPISPTLILPYGEIRIPMKNSAAPSN